MLESPSHKTALEFAGQGNVRKNVEYFLRKTEQLQQILKFISPFLGFARILPYKFKKERAPSVWDKILPAPKEEVKTTEAPKR